MKIDLFDAMDVIEKMISGPSGAQTAMRFGRIMKQRKAGDVVVSAEVEEEAPKEKAPVPNEKEIPKPKAKEPVPKKIIDRNKVIALYNAGRTAKWIADDMGISVASAYAIIKEAKSGEKE